MLFFRLFSALSLVLFGFGAAEAKPVILSIGDSLTFGLGVPPEKTWPALLEKRPSVSLRSAFI
jgi:hypothetical protein